MIKGKINEIAKTVNVENVGSIIRRFFINTLFDSTFTLLGIIVGVSFVSDAHYEIVLLTMLTASFALSISTGVSVYEAESLEREREMSHLENAMLTDLSDTQIGKSAKNVIILTALINFSTPLMACGLTSIPFIMVYLNILEIGHAMVFSVAIALGILFCAGVYLGRLGKQNPWLKGLRMVLFGLLAFAIGYSLESLFLG